MKKTIMSLLLFLGVLSASAQAEQKGTTEYVFQPHWYITLQGGGQYTLGEGKFGDLLSPTAQIGVGYNFTKVVGLRLAVNAWQSKGVIKLDDTDMSPAQSYEGKWKWNYVAPSLEFTFNLSNIVCNYNPNRLLNVYALIGGGANIGFKNDEAQTVENQIIAYQNSNSNLVYDGKQNMRYLWDGTKVRPFGKAGLLFDFRVSDKVSINIEGNANTLSDKYNSKKAGNWDWYFNALAGVKINLGKTYTTKFIPDPEPEIRYVEKVVEKVVEVPAKVEVKPIEKMRRDIFFTINSFKVRETEAEKIKDIADYLNANPRAKVEVTGYADAGTGNNRINDRLAKQRADVVVKTLMNDYNISANRIFFDSKGSRVQPFAENDLNRVTICIAE
ncbi:MAG: OmpA family protein [Prevotella sp.]|nr:OmpA family protein [Prevotella sp.]